MDTMSTTKSFNAVDKHQISLAWSMIQAAKKITLLTHYNPDGDGVSACAALDYILQKQDKIVETVYPTPLKVPIKRQPAKVLINVHEQVPDLIIICDTANYERLYYPEAFKGIPTINIDHHVSSSIQSTFNFVDPVALSTCDYLYRILMVIDSTLINAHVADCLLYGILYDTQTFSIQSTNGEVLGIAADLVTRGAQYSTLVQELKHNKNVQEVKLWGHVLANIAHNESKSAVWLVAGQKDLQALGLKSDALSGIENFIAQLASADVTIFFYEDEHGLSKASFRGKHTDVNAVAQKFGGGGHKFAAGLMSKIPLNELVKQVTACFV